MLNVTLVQLVNANTTCYSEQFNKLIMFLATVDTYEKFIMSKRKASFILLTCFSPMLQRIFPTAQQRNDNRISNESLTQHKFGSCSLSWKAFDNNIEVILRIPVISLTKSQHQL